MKPFLISILLYILHAADQFKNPKNIFRVIHVVHTQNIFQKTNSSYLEIRTCTCAYQEF